MENFDIKVNQFPSLTWNFLNINYTNLEFNSKFTSIDFDGKKLDELYSNCNIQTGLGKDFDETLDKLLVDNEIKTQFFESDSNLTKKFVFLAKANESLVSDIFIHAKENTNSTYIFVYKSESDSYCQLGSRIRVLADDNSYVHIVTINLLGKNVLHFNSIGSKCGDNATIEITELELGGKSSYSGTFNQLAGYKSKFIGHASYVMKDESSFDMNQVSSQSGKSSESHFTVDGVLLDNAKKTWRGTIDFKKGCIDSVGDEQEDVLLLSPQAVNKSLPVILCDEEAVEGRHGCSIGKIDMDKLFYMQSRGVDEETAKELLTKAKISKVTRFISDEQLVNEIDSFVAEIIC